MDPIKKRNIRNWAFLIGTILIVFVLGILATSIIERKYESSYAGLEKKTSNKMIHVMQFGANNFRNNMKVIWLQRILHSKVCTTEAP